VHELAQPLTSILWNADVARKTLLSPEANVEKTIQIVEDICGSAQRASELIRRLRSFLTQHEPPREAVCVSRLLARRMGDLFVLQVEGALTSLEIAETLMQSTAVTGNIESSLKALRDAHRRIRRLLGDPSK